MPRLISAYSNARSTAELVRAGADARYVAKAAHSAGLFCAITARRAVAIQELGSPELRFAPRIQRRQRWTGEVHQLADAPRGKAQHGSSLVGTARSFVSGWASLNVKPPDDCRQLEQLYILGWYWGCRSSMTEQHAPRVILRRYIGSAICDVLVLVRGQEMVIRCRSYPQALKWARLECKSYRIPEPELEPLREVDGDEPPLFLRSHAAEENHD